MMKRTILSLAVLVFVAGIIAVLYVNMPKKQPISYTSLDEYFVRNDVPLAETGLNYFIIENQDEINALFGIAKTMDNQIQKIDFSKEIVLAIAKSPTTKEAKLEINSVNLINNNLYVDYQYKEGGEKTYSSVPLKIISLEKPAALLDLYFTENGKTIEKIALGRRNLNSPQSQEDLNNNYTGTFVGTFPCADCSGIETSLTLNKDGTYQLDRTYIGKTTIPIRETGKWTPSEDLSLVELLDSQTYFYINDIKSIELMSPDAKRINSEFNYRLIKTEK